MNKIEKKLLKVWTDAGLPAEQFSLDMPSIVFAMRTSSGRARIVRDNAACMYLLPPCERGEGR
jgi:hypothetical protein